MNNRIVALYNELTSLTNRVNCPMAIGNVNLLLARFDVIDAIDKRGIEGMRTHMDESGNIHVGKIDFDEFKRDNFSARCYCRQEFFVVNDGTPTARCETQVEWDPDCPVHSQL